MFGSHALKAAALSPMPRLEVGLCLQPARGQGLQSLVVACALSFAGFVVGDCLGSQLLSLDRPTVLAAVTLTREQQFVVPTGRPSRITLQSRAQGDKIEIQLSFRALSYGKATSCYQPISMAPYS